MSYLDINHVRSYLRKAKVTFNKGDKITVNGDLSKLEGHVDVFGLLDSISILCWSMCQLMLAVVVQFTDSYYHR